MGDFTSRSLQSCFLAISSNSTLCFPTVFHLRKGGGEEKKEINSSLLSPFPSPFTISQGALSYFPLAAEIINVLQHDLSRQDTVHASLTTQTNIAAIRNEFPAES